MVRRKAVEGTLQNKSNRKPHCTPPNLLFYTGDRYQQSGFIAYSSEEKMKHRHALIFAFLASAMLLQACGGANAESAIQTGIAQTLQISQLQTAAAGGGGGVATNTPESGQPTNTSAPSETPTITLTSTPSIPYVSVSQNTNCRTGPSQFYGYVTTANAGQQFEVLKTFSGANYVVIRNPSGSGDCWLWLQYANETNFSAYNLPVATKPPTPFPTNTPTNTPVPFDFSGSWNVKAVQGGSTFTGPGSFAVSGQSISGSFTLNPGGYNYSFSGTLNSSLQVASGNWTLSGGGSGSFTWQIKSGNTNQFVGNLDGGAWEFCGWRSGSSAPSPCSN
jgi:hypothetical protein